MEQSDQKHDEPTKNNQETKETKDGHEPSQELFIVYNNQEQINLFLICFASMMTAAIDHNDLDPTTILTVGSARDALLEFLSNVRDGIYAGKFDTTGLGLSCRILEADGTPAGNAIDINELKLNGIPPPSDDTIHMHVTCDECKTTPIVGQRFKCMACKDFDLCSTCLNNNVHSHHKFHQVKYVWACSPDKTITNSNRWVIILLNTMINNYLELRGSELLLEDSQPVSPQIYKQIIKYPIQLVNLRLQYDPDPVSISEDGDE